MEILLPTRELHGAPLGDDWRSPLTSCSSPSPSCLVIDTDTTHYYTIRLKNTLYFE